VYNILAPTIGRKHFGLDRHTDLAYLGTTMNNPVAQAFLLYGFYVCLPLIPTILLFRLFPDQQVWVSGPLKGFKISATGAYAAYIVTVALGFSLVRYIETQIDLKERYIEAQIDSDKRYAVEGVFLDLGRNQYVSSDDFYSQYAPVGIDPSQMPERRNSNFVMLFHHPVVTSEKVDLQYWEIHSVGGLGALPASKKVVLILRGGSSNSKQQFRLQVNGDVVKAVEAEAQPILKPQVEVAMGGSHYAP